MTSSIIVDTELITLVRAHPVLYKKVLRSRPYDFMKRKTEVWKSIGMSLGVDTPYCIMRWKHLRQRYRDEYAKSKQLGDKANIMWPLFQKMQFLNNDFKHYCLHHIKGQARQKVCTSTWNDMDAEQLIEEVSAYGSEDALEESMMDEGMWSMAKVTESAVTSTPNTPLNPSMMRRIEVLLEGLDAANRNKAEKSILAYLCKCQLKALNNEDLDGVNVG